MNEQSKKSNHSVNGKFRSKCGFATVSLYALRDNNLSLKAKGLYSLIESYIRIPDFVLWKNTLINCSTDGIRSFNTAWDELKKTGYLKQYRIRIEKGWKYEYELLDEPDLNTPATIDVNMASEIIERNNEDTLRNESKDANENNSNNENTSENSTVDSTELEYSKVLKKVNERLEIDEYINYLPERTKEVALNIRDIIIEVLLSTDKKIKIGNEIKNGDEVRATFNRFTSRMLMYLIDKLSDYDEDLINPKAFIVTCIYNEVKSGIAYNLPYI